jgi:WD40 repeat protein
MDSVAISPDGLRIVSGDSRNTVSVWDTATGKRKLVLTGHTTPVSSVAISPDGKRIVSAGDNTVKVWDVETGQEMISLKEHTDLVFCVAFSADGTRILSGSRDKTVKVWNAPNASP